MREGHKKEANTANLCKLPPLCYILLPSTLETVMVKRGESGIHSPLYDASPDELNNMIGITPQQAAAMECGVLRGWDSPSVDPDVYDDRGRLKPEVVQALMHELRVDRPSAVIAKQEKDAEVAYIQEVNTGKKLRIRGRLAVEPFPVTELDVTIQPVPASFSFSCVHFNGLNHDDYAQAEGVFEVATEKNEKGTFDLRDFIDGRIVRRGFKTEHDAAMWLALHHTGRDLLDTSWSKGILIQVEGTIDHALAARLEIPTYGDAMIFPSLGINARSKIIAYQVLKHGALSPDYADFARTRHGRDAMRASLPDGLWLEVCRSLISR